jgi:alcohol dehydrogenase class IV
MTSPALAGEFVLTRLECVIYGPGKIAALKDDMERRQLRRALVVATEGVAALPVLDEVAAALRPYSSSFKALERMRWETSA